MIATGTRPAGTSGRAATTLAAVLLGFLALPMLMSGTTVALPQIAAELGASGASLQWVVVGYFLAAGSMMLVAGELGDRYGRRRVFAAGAVLYATGGLVGATTAHVLVLDVARTVSGIGAAGVMAGGAALLAATFIGPARTRAFAAMGATAGVGLAVGPTLAGWLVGALGWRATFGVFAVVGVALLLGTAAMVESRTAARPPLDVPGAISFVGGLGLVLFGVNLAATAGWASVGVLAPVVGGLLAMALFTVHERRSAHPVLDLTLLRDRSFTAWCLACLVAAVGPAGVMAFLPTYLHGVNGVPAQTVGAIMTMLAAPVVLVPLLSGALVNRGLPPRTLVTAGLLLIAAGNAWLTVLHPGIGVPALLGPLATIGVGMGATVGVVDAQAMNHVEPDRLGMAAGLLNTLRAAGSTLVIALFGTGLVTLLRQQAGRPETAARIAAGDLSGTDTALHAAHFTAAWHVVLWTVAAGCAAAALAVWALLAPSAPISAGTAIGVEPPR